MRRLCDPEECFTQLLYNQCVAIWMRMALTGSKGLAILVGVTGWSKCVIKERAPRLQKFRSEPVVVPLSSWCLWLQT